MAHSIPKLSDFDCDSSVDDEINAAIARVETFTWEFAEAEEGNGEYPETFSGYPYCGCETCVGREYMSAAFPIISQAALDGRIWRSSTAEDVAVTLLEKDSLDRTTHGNSDDSDPDRSTRSQASDSGDP